MKQSLILAAAVVLVVWVAWAFNRLISLRNRLREAWSGIDVQLKRRHDLVPELVECVRGYRNHEQRVLEQVTQARAQAQAAVGAAQAGPAEDSLVRGLRSIFVLAEAYPELKADQNFRKLSETLVEIEDQIQYARRYYNGSVRDFNIQVESFPGRIVARLFGFQPQTFFEVESAVDRQVPEVKL